MFPTKHGKKIKKKKGKAERLLSKKHLKKRILKQLKKIELGQDIR